MVARREGLVRVGAGGPVPWFGLALLVPGWCQRSWGQPARGAVLLGTTASAWLAGAFLWGRPAGLAMLASAFAAHAAATADVIRQRSFPGYGRGAVAAAAASAVGLALYGPALALACLLAWPGPDAGGEGPVSGFLVNRRAYDAAGPRAGEMIWLDRPGPGRSHVARVVAGPGQDVDWSAGRLTVAGRYDPAGLPGGGAGVDLSFVVPDGLVLVDRAGLGLGRGRRDLALLPAGGVVGRAWARYYPIWDRQLLF